MTRKSNGRQHTIEILSVYFFIYVLVKYINIIDVTHKQYDF